MRDARSVPEIREAAELLETWERSVNDVAAAKGFSEAVQMLDEYLEAEPDTPHRAFIQNLKLSHTRRLLQQLAQLDRRDFGLWLEYAVSALAVVERETESVLAARPGLKADLEAFQKVWGDTVAQAVRRPRA